MVNQLRYSREELFSLKNVKPSTHTCLHDPLYHRLVDNGKNPPTRCIECNIVSTLQSTRKPSLKMCVQCVPRIWKTLLIVSLPTRMRSGMPLTNMRPLWCVSSRFDQRRRGAHSSCRTQSEICDVQRVVGQNSKLVVHREIFTSCRNDYKRHLIATKAEYCCTMVDEAGRYMKNCSMCRIFCLAEQHRLSFRTRLMAYPPERFNTFFVDTISRIICRIDARAEPTVTEYQYGTVSADMKHTLVHRYTHDAVWTLTTLPTIVPFQT